MLKEFEDRGYAIKNADDLSELTGLRDAIFERARTQVKGGPKDPTEFFNQFHQHRLSGGELNSIRMDLIEFCTRELQINQRLFRAFEPTLTKLVGVDVAAQRVVNIVIQQPGDAEQVPIHRDAPSNSHFEVIVWLPLVDCFRTKSMYLLDQEKSGNALGMLKSGKTYSEFCDYTRKHAEDLSVPFGSACFFAAGLAHGCEVNVEAETRWSLNIRYKNLFAPYGPKGLLEYFEILKISPLAKIGFDFESQEYG